MDFNSRIYVAGHTGLVGSALVRTLEKMGYQHICVFSRKEYDLTVQSDVQALFQKHQPEYVFLAAAKVGGIWANQHYPAEFIAENLAIQNNIITQAHQNQVKRLLFLGSSCIYPRLCPQPIDETYLLSGPLEKTNRPYALAKIAGIEMCWAHNRQYGTQFLAAMPTNLYGPNDNYDLNTSHVIPALIRKMHEATIHNAPEVILWGTGTPRREFLYSDDLAKACIHLMQLSNTQIQPLLNEEEPPLVNIGCGEDVTIRELGECVANVVGFKGKIIFDTSKPDGTPRKVLNIQKIKNLGWMPEISLSQGLQKAYDDFKTYQKK